MSYIFFRKRTDSMYFLLLLVNVSVEVLNIVLLSKLPKLDLHSNISFELSYFYTVELGEWSKLPTMFLFGQLKQLTLVCPFISTLHFLLILRATLWMLSRYVASQRLRTFKRFRALRTNIIRFFLAVFILR